MSVLATVSFQIYPIVTDKIVFSIPKRKEIAENVWSYVINKINAPEASAWMQANSNAKNPFWGIIKENYVLLGGTLLLFYALFYILKKMKRNDSEFSFHKTIVAYGIMLAGHVFIGITIPSLSGDESNIASICYIVFGSVIGILFVLLMPCFPLDVVMSKEDIKIAEEKEKLSQVVKTVDKKTLRNGWETIAGYKDVIDELKQVLEPYLDKKVMKKMEEANIPPVKGLLLFGPPGSGKTLFARAIAAESKMNIITVAGAEFTSKWVGESDKNLRMIFEQAREQAPCLIFFDELESFLPRREQAQYSWEKTLVTTFLTQMDGFQELKDVLVVGATNYPDQIDPAAIRPGRFDKCIYISEPDVEAKIEILKKYLGTKSQFTNDELKNLAVKLERFTAADIEGLIIELYRQNHFEALVPEDIINASANYHPTITLDMRDKYAALEKKYNRRLIDESEEKTKEKKYTWNDIAGMEKEKKDIRKFVEKPLLHANKYKELDLEYPKGVLMFGPPGCGKTLFAKVIANECNASFFTINGPELLSAQIGESEKKLRRVFRTATEQKPSIIFFDGIMKRIIYWHIYNNSFSLISKNIYYPIYSCHYSWCISYPFFFHFISMVLFFPVYKLFII